MRWVALAPPVRLAEVVRRTGGYEEGGVIYSLKIQSKESVERKR